MMPIHETCRICGDLLKGKERIIGVHTYCVKDTRVKRKRIKSIRYGQ